MYLIKVPILGIKQAKQMQVITNTILIATTFLYEKSPQPLAKIILILAKMSFLSMKAKSGNTVKSWKSNKILAIIVKVSFLGKLFRMFCKQNQLVYTLIPESS